MKQRSRLLMIGVSLCAASAIAQTPPFALKPRPPTGFSGPEQRYVYAPPDEGSFRVSLVTGQAAPTEVSIAEPSMCEGSAQATIRYSKKRNEVVLDADFDGLPYRMSYTRPVDVSTPYNRFPVSVEDGVWQIWFVGRMLSFETKFYYDASTLQLIGSETEFPNGPPANAITITLPTMHMVASPLFEGKPNGKAHVTFRYAYDRILDEHGKGGTYFAYTPFNLCKPDEYGPYYFPKGGLPVEKALTFDQVLESIHQGYGMALATSLEPKVKPEWLLSRDNTMIGWSGTYPVSTPEGIGTDPINGTVVLSPSCGTHIKPNYAKAHYNLCAGN